MVIYEKSATHYLLKALIPYTSANLALSYKPSAFFNELELIGKQNQHAYRNAYYRAIQKGLIEITDNGVPKLTAKANRALAPFESKKLRGAELMVIFDIPETGRWRRDQFRKTLREFKFKQIQKSVWTTAIDCKKYVLLEIKNLHLEKEVKLFESRLIK